ncbi:hypothetical protein Nepgr_026634 [Nepenthes gracilis]|uniref:Uncharacterized protein n=1 Tax=Nepenthes gracilis TaxID=150966 RepID=A0AAD3T8W7_NEPGR|nr:hypothetical protein Nepgr_026634 [Nepenthes gracilis]
MAPDRSDATFGSPSHKFSNSGRALIKSAKPTSKDSFSNNKTPGIKHSLSSAPNSPPKQANTSTIQWSSEGGNSSFVFRSLHATAGPRETAQHIIAATGPAVYSSQFSKHGGKGLQKGTKPPTPKPATAVFGFAHAGCAFPLLLTIFVGVCTMPDAVGFLQFCHWLCFYVVCFRCPEAGSNSSICSPVLCLVDAHLLMGEGPYRAALLWGCNYRLFADFCLLKNGLSMELVVFPRGHKCDLWFCHVAVNC